MRELALFAGVGGGILGGRLLGWRTVCAVEIDPYCREILLRRQEDGQLPPFPVWGDIRTFDGGPWCGLVEVVSAGFPCQPFSLAGQRRGADDERNLWPETIRILREVRPRFALLENVPAILYGDRREGQLPNASYYGAILRDLADSGFDATWRVLSAAECGAPHKRDRLWIYCYAQGSGADLADADSEGPQDAKGSKHTADRPRRPAAGDCGWWDAEPRMGRVADGVPYRVGRLKALGNAQVPIVAAQAWALLRRQAERRV